MSHFLDKNGTIPESQPNKARKLSQRIGAIVLAVTQDPRNSQSTIVPCWNIINGVTIHHNPLLRVGSW